VPFHQAQFLLLRSIFEKTLEYKDSLFYDITSWTMPLAFGISHQPLTAKQFGRELLGEKIEQPIEAKGKLSGRSSYGYLLNWNHFNAPGALYALQQEGILAKLATNPFVIEVEGRNKNYDAGTI